ncbi:MAG: hypothetical protein AAF149_00470 [Bacteroidota bacterium]
MVFNDGVERPETFFSEFKGQLTCLSAKGDTLAQVRFNALDYLQTLQDTKLIFCDIDDTMSSNRIECLSLLLDKYDVVCNDLSVVDNENILIIKNLWCQRLGSRFEFDYNFIAQSNVVGFGNVAFKSSILRTGILPTNEDIVADWFIFYQILFRSKIIALFTADCTTLYRQHVNNTVGAGGGLVSVKKLHSIINIKLNHYKALVDIGINMKAEIDDLISKQSKMASYTPTSINAPFWWEETKLLDGKNS